MGSDQIKTEYAYRDWIQGISARYNRSRERAAVNGNSETLRFCWSLGRDLEQQKGPQRDGWLFYQLVSNDIKDASIDEDFFSPRKLFFMHRFYKLFPELFSSFCATSPGETTETEKQDVSKLSAVRETQLSESSQSTEAVLMISWDHLVIILNKYGTDREKTLFYIRKSVEYNWPVPGLAFFLETDYEGFIRRQGDDTDIWYPSFRNPCDTTQAIPCGESVPEAPLERELRNVRLMPVGHFRELPGGDWTDSSFYESFCGSVLDHLYQESPENVEKIVAYLDQGLPLINNRLCFGDDPLAPDGRGVYCGPEYTDGIWLWPEYLSYYVEHYQLKLPTAFVETMRINAWEVPASFEVLGVDSLEIGEKTFCGKCGEKMLIIRDPLWSGMTCPSCGWGWKKLSSELENADEGRDHLLN